MRGKVWKLPGWLVPVGLVVLLVIIDHVLLVEFIERAMRRKGK